MNYWLMKSEPTVYSIEDLENDGKTEWEGVRNYQARNFMRDQMQMGDLVLFYHSNAEPPGIAGIAIITREAAVDPFQFDKHSPYYDAAAHPDRPRWLSVELSFVEKFPNIISLDAIKKDPKLCPMEVARRGNRLSVQPVKPAEFNHVLRKAGARFKK